MDFTPKTLPTNLEGETTALYLAHLFKDSDIKVTNNHDYPVKIIMWTEGSGTGMVIYAKIIRLQPTNTADNSK